MTDPTPQELQAAGELYEQLDRRPTGTVVAHPVFPMLAWRDGANEITLLNRPKVVRSDSVNKLSVAGFDIVGEETKIATRGRLARDLRAQIEVLTGR